ncbi:unnamed protein product [Penicillium olsonii]|uniref:DJ-1/PfpI domain-containing protein n=1 Tax=Penicillium olsonii TaxID=99116 RepID=A0A9W4IIZ9_PENOL|nr:unnamed protein product [Penicillium olsonii]CAG8298617.1 unnamed protein product [Penicillium olsonii]
MALHIGVLLLNTPQLLDLAAIDLFYMTTPTYLTACSLPTPLLSLARPLTIHYIAPQTPVSTTSNLTILPTHTLSSPDIAPHTLDILLIPGPSPQAHIPEDILDFVAAHHAAGTDILSICTAALVIASAGVSAGRRVTGPRLMIPELRARFPESNWVDGRVVRDRNLWSCGVFPLLSFFLLLSLLFMLGSDWFRWDYEWAGSGGCVSV